MEQRGGSPFEEAERAGTVAKPPRNRKEWEQLLAGGMPKREAEVIRQSARTGRALGSEGSLDALEALLERPLKKLKPGPKKAERGN